MKIIEFEHTAKEIKPGEVAVWTDGLAVSTDDKWHGVYSLVAGQRYRVRLQIEVIGERVGAGAEEAAK